MTRNLMPPEFQDIDLVVVWQRILGYGNGTPCHSLNPISSPLQLGHIVKMPNSIYILE